MLPALILLVAGLAMGFINNLAGAGGLLALAAFEFAAGLDPTESNAAMRPAAIAIGVAGMLGFLSKGKRVPRHVWWWGIATIPGAVAGALLALRLPAWVYQTVLAIVVTFLVIRLLVPRARVVPAPVDPDGAGNGGRTPVGWLAGMLWFTAVGAHMGFVQVGTGLVAIAALSALHSPDLITVNAAKMVLVICAATSSTLVLAIGGAIDPVPSLLLALGAGLGSFLAGRLSVGRGHGFVRVAVLAVCAFTLARIGVALFRG